MSIWCPPKKAAVDVFVSPVNGPQFRLYYDYYTITITITIL